MPALGHTRSRSCESLLSLPTGAAISSETQHVEQGFLDSAVAGSGPPGVQRTQLQPSDIHPASAALSLDAADAQKKQDALAELARKQAQAQAEPPAVAAMETEAFRVQQQALANSLGVQGGVANMADLACIIGGLIPRDDPDANQFGQALRGACGVGDQVRRNMVDTLKKGGQEGSTLIQRPAPGSP